MKRNPLAYTCSLLTISALSASAAVTMTFTQNGADVELTMTGTLSTSNFSTPGSAIPAATGDNFLFNADGHRMQFLANDQATSDVYELDTGSINTAIVGTGGSGGLLTRASLSSSSASHTASHEADRWEIYESGLMYVQHAGGAGSDVDFDMQATFANTTIADLGLDSLAKNTDHLLWEVSSGTTNENEKFYINIVPEPSSTALLGLGGIALLLRRRK